MRIISQNGTIDVPYDMCCVWRQEEVIYCRVIGSDDNVMMATYSSEDKAEKVIGWLMEKHLEYKETCVGLSYTPFVKPKMFRFPLDENFE
jgi:hypothetical protein